MFDLLIRHGRVIDALGGIDRMLDVGFAEGRVAAIEAALPPDNARSVIDAAGCLVVPGLVDLHTHVYWGGTSLGVDADAIARRSGTTTFVDAGSAGAGNILGFRRHVIERATVRILAYLNISFAGIYGFSRDVMVGECGDIRLCHAESAVAAAREHADILTGIKVRVGRTAGGASGAAPLDIAIEAADELQMPVMAHIDHPPPSRTEVLQRLRRGDVLTHCFRPFPNAPMDGKRLVRPEIAAARERGVIFDIGHGAGSFAFASARAMLKHGFLPDVISSDVHTLSIDGPVYDNLVTMSKFLSLGVPLPDVIRMASMAPARAIGHPELGTLTVGGIGDAAVLELQEGEFDFVDVRGQHLAGTQRLVSHGIVVGGKFHAATAG